jgi:hypothetical protein
MASDTAKKGKHGASSQCWYRELVHLSMRQGNAARRKSQSTEICMTENPRPARHCGPVSRTQIVLDYKDSFHGESTLILLLSPGPGLICVQETSRTGTASVSVLTKDPH